MNDFDTARDALDAYSAGYVRRDRGKRAARGNAVGAFSMQDWIDMKAENERLRDEIRKWPPLPVITQERVDDLHAEIERLREALREIAENSDPWCEGQCGDAARAALGEQP